MSSVFEKNTFGQNKGSRKICLDKLRVYGIILWSVMESCPSGRRSMIGNHVYGEHRTEGSNPSLSAKKEVTFVYQKLLLFLSKPQAWHIITTQSCISSAPLGLYLITRQRASSCGLMRCNTACWWYAIPMELMIYKASPWFVCGKVVSFSWKEWAFFL